MATAGRDSVADRPGTAVVVGSGPNGLTAAARLAVNGWQVHVVEAADEPGGACRSVDLFGRGTLHDVGAAVHPLGAASPAFAALGVHDRITWRHPPHPLVHIVDGTRAAIVERDLGATADALGSPRYGSVLGGLSERWEHVRDTVLAPLLAVPSHPAALAHLAVPSALHADGLGRLLGGDAREVIVGCAAHAGTRLDRPATAGTGLLLALCAHTVGWPVAAGGAQAITDALVAIVREHGGTIETGRRVRSLRELPKADAVLLDVSPPAFVAIAGDALRGTRSAHRRFRHGVGVVKLDLVLGEPMPWLAGPARTAGTLHLGGDTRSILTAERTVAGGSLPTRPFVIAGQPAVADPARGGSGASPWWAYTHVPNGAGAGVVAAAVGLVESELDRQAPGWRDVVVERAVTGPAELEAGNPNLVGGDIASGSLAGRRLLARPRATTHPYRTELAGVWLCSASTPPGPGAHGMCGWHAAGAVLDAAADETVSSRGRRARARRAPRPMTHR